MRLPAEADTVTMTTSFLYGNSSENRYRLRCSALTVRLPKEKLHIFLDAQRLPSLEGSLSLSSSSFLCTSCCALHLGLPSCITSSHTPPSQRKRTGTMAVLGGRDFKGWIIYCRSKLLGSDPAPQDFSLLFIHLPFNFLP